MPGFRRVRLYVYQTLLLFYIHALFVRRFYILQLLPQLFAIYKNAVFADQPNDQLLTGGGSIPAQVTIFCFRFHYNLHLVHALSQ